MVNNFSPSLLAEYFETFKVAFNSPGYSYFKAFIRAFMLIPGRKRVRDSILGLLSPFFGRWLCFPIIARLISDKNNPSLFVSTLKGLRPANFWDVTVSNVPYA